MEVFGDLGANAVLGAPQASQESRVHFHSTGCRLEIGDNCRFHKLEIHFHRPDQVVRFAGDNSLGGWIYLRGAGCRFEMGARTRADALLWANVGEPGRKVVIGDDCLFAYVKFRTSDSHSIFDSQTGERLNPAADIEVGDRVWLAEDVLLLPGAKVGSGSVVGARSLVTGSIPPHSLAVGSPARVVRSGVRWEP